jgi:hypothetical protein
MSIISSLVALIVLGGSLIVVTLYHKRAFIRELFSRRNFREETRNRITHLRFGKVLAKKGIDLQYYLFTRTDAAIMKQIRNCKRCCGQALCDYYLDNKEMDNNIELTFCPNKDSITIPRTQSM